MVHKVKLSLHIHYIIYSLTARYTSDVLAGAILWRTDTTNGKKTRRFGCAGAFYRVSLSPFSGFWFSKLTGW